MVTYQIIPSSHKPTDGQVSPKVTFLVENRASLIYREFLIQLFTYSTKHTFDLPANVLGKDTIKIDADTAFELDTLMEQRIVAIPKNSKPISFPKSDDIEALKLQDRIITTRIMVEKNKYSMGDIVVAPWGYRYVVSKRVVYKRLIDHPYYNELTDSQKAEIGTNFFDVLTLDKLDGSRPVLSGRDFYIYGVAFKTIGDHDLPLNDTNGKTPCSVILVKLSESGDIPIFTPTDTFKLQNGMIENYTESAKAIETTVGRYLLNYLILVRPFNKLFTYINEPFNIGKIDTMVATELLNKTIGRKEYDDYMAYGFFIGQFSEFSVPGLSRKSLTTDPKIKALREKLLKEHAHELGDPTVLTAIETQLVEADKEWIKGDSSEHFYAVTANKSYNEHRKKMFLTMGLMQSFKSTSTEYTFIPNSLSEGFDIKYMPDVANEIRRGSYDRGKNTANGGVQTKDLLRIFSTLRIVADDCHTNGGIRLLLTEENYKHYIKRYTMHAGKSILLTNDNIKEFIGKNLIIRSPMYCKTKEGLCNICAGEYFKELNSTAIGMLALDVGSKFTSISMKSMHFSGIKSTTIHSLSPFFYG